MAPRLLSAIIGCAVITRATAIWLTRPEFVGWFNHSYYYWVQVRGLLETGSLPLDDLPVLFYAYAGIASLLQVAGLDPQVAIIHTTRAVMSVVPALIAWPTLLILRRTTGSRQLPVASWLLVAASAILPLTIVHIPEMLQKNALGLLLLAVVLSVTLSQLHERTRRKSIALAVLLMLIALTHLGTLVAVLLGGIAFVASVIVVAATPQPTIADPTTSQTTSAPTTSAPATSESTGSGPTVARQVGFVVVFLLVSLTSLRLVDPDAFARVVDFATSSIPNSMIGAAIGATSNGQRLQALAGVVVPFAILAGLMMVFRRHRPDLDKPDQIFWLANILFAYALVAPIIDVAVLPRLVLFMPLPAIPILGYTMRYASPRWRWALGGAPLLGALLMLVGEMVSLAMMYPDKDNIYAELVQVRQDYALSTDDFIIAPYGVPPICNWFLGTRAGLVTSFNRSDVDKYTRVFVLNPAELQPAVATRGGSAERIVETDMQRYQVMRSAVPIATDSTNVDESASYRYFNLTRLDGMPPRWIFDDSGNWIGWRDDESDAMEP